MIITPAQDSDLKEIATLFADAFGEDAVMYSTSKPDGFFVARLGEELVGAAKFFRNGLHALMPKLAIAVAKDHRRKGIARKIHEAVLATKPELPLGLDGICFDDDVPALAFMNSLGYESYLDCYIPVVNLKANLPEIRVAGPIEIVTLASALDLGFERSQISDYLVKKYWDSHDFNPPTLPIEHPEWMDISLGDSDPSLSFVAIDGKTIKGAATGYLAGSTLQIAWVFAEGNTFDEEVALIKALMTRQYEAATSNGAITATFESDSTDPGVGRACEGWSILEARTWRRFRLLPG